MQRRYRMPPSVRDALRRQHHDVDDKIHQERQRKRWKDIGKLLVFVLFHALTNGR